MSVPDENYDEPGSPGSRASNSPRSSDGIAGLDMNPVGVQAPTGGPDLVMAGPGARSANFGQILRYPDDQYDANANMQEQYMQSGDHDDAFLRQLLHGNGDNDNDSNHENNVVRHLMRSQIGQIQEIGPQHAEQVLNMIQPQPLAYSDRELNQLQQRRREQQQLRQLRIILQNCDRPRVLRLFASIDRAHIDERGLRRAVQQLDDILEMPQQIPRNWGGINNVTRSHSRAFERLRCRTPQARRALHAFISGLRNQLRGRLRAMTARRRPQQQSQQPPQQPQPKGGKRQTKKRAFKRNKTTRISQKK
jgi:hypothetical protein